MKENKNLVKCKDKAKIVLIGEMDPDSDKSSEIDWTGQENVDNEEIEEKGVTFASNESFKLIHM